MRHKLVLFITLVGLLIISLFLLVFVFQDAKQGTIEFEAAKALLQIGIVAVAGAVVSVLVFEYQSESQKRDKDKELNRKNLEYRDALLLSTLKETMNAYGQTKKARRLLRGRAVVSRDQVDILLAELYDVYIDVLNDAQLSLENLARDVQTSAKAFSNAAVIADHMWSMESYLGKLIREYEETRGHFLGDEPSLPLKELKYLSDFLQSSKISEFRPQVVAPFHEIQRLIRSDLLYPNLPELDSIDQT